MMMQAASPASVEERADRTAAGEGEHRVTQAMLARYLELKPLVEEYKRLDASLRWQLDHGAPVEEGEYEALFNVGYYPRLTVNFVAAHLGLTEGELDEIRRHSPGVRMRYMTVRKTPQARRARRRKQTPLKLPVPTVNDTTAEARATENIWMKGYDVNWV